MRAASRPAGHAAIAGSVGGADHAIAGHAPRTAGVVGRGGQGSVAAGGLAGRDVGVPPHPEPLHARAVTTCAHCQRRKGKRTCPALAGMICPGCCGKHRGVDLACPTDCRWLGAGAGGDGDAAAALAYDAEHAPAAARWLAASEDERHAAIIAAHRDAPPGEGTRLHATAHVVVENQLASGLPEPTAALARLVAAGVERHQAIHALASVVVAEIYGIMAQHRPYDPARVGRGLAALSPDDWR